jgi:predicted ATP-dependent serine protease
MDLDECERCGEEFPAVWGKCPECGGGDRPSFKLDEDDFWI